MATLTNSSITKAFLNQTDSKIKNEILINVANCYGITTAMAYEELISEDAESLMDYITGSIRPAISVIFNRFKVSLSK